MINIIIKSDMHLLHFVVIFCLAFFSGESFTRNNVLDSIDVSKSRDQSVITIKFTERLIYRSHAPEKQADLIYINVNLQSKFDAAKLNSEFLIWKPTDSVPLFEVSLEATSLVQAELVLRFDNQVEFDVQGSSDSYSVSITVYHPQKEQPITQPPTVAK